MVDYLGMIQNQNIIISLSKLHGRGLITTKAIRPEEKILHIKGKVLKLAAFFKLPQKIKDNTYRFSANEYLTPQGEYGDFLNHSCQPNSRVIKKGRRLYLVATQKILKGSEILIDYSTILAKDDYWIMKCSCGTKFCRGKIKRYNTLPQDVLNDYLTRGLIPPYILSIT